MPELREAWDAMTTDLIPKDIRDRYEVREWKHACAVLKEDFPREWHELLSVLRDFCLHERDILARGGGLSLVSKAFNKAFNDRGWKEKAFETKIVIG